eukprot:c9144_g1_i1.p1 GENE.c9144_g1_i1~~c9144_g1_i1.p1  ORF type:complete len:971 (+),score=219.31 c9144_g1_i1:89-3001(+)
MLDNTSSSKFQSSPHALQSVSTVTHPLEPIANNSDDTSKFATKPKFSCGTIDDYHAGLGARLGYADLSFMERMEAEHTKLLGCDTGFTTPNYQITTTPKQEWGYVVRGAECPPEQRGNGRRMVPLHQLMELPSTKTAGLRECEVAAIVLYTGPMYVLYNAMLRKYPKTTCAAFNEFTTTILVLVSAIQKLCRSSHIEEGVALFRGLGSFKETDLPDHFLVPDERGCRGFTEWGFMSTTSSKDVAVSTYSGVRDNGSGMLIEMHVTSVDRGASVIDYSQYPAEEEYLWVPCSFVQPAGPSYTVLDQSKPVTIVPVRVNANIKTETIDELEHRKKSMHLTSFRNVVEELVYELNQIVNTTEVRERYSTDRLAAELPLTAFVGSIVDQCRAVVTKHVDLPVEAFKDDQVFRATIGEMLDVKAWAKQKFSLWLHDSTYSLSNMASLSLRDCHRKWVQYIVRSKGLVSPDGATEYLKARGRVTRHANEVNSDGEACVEAAAADGGWDAKEMSALIVATDSSVYDKALFAAARHGNVEWVEALLKAGGDVNKTKKDGVSNVYIAAYNGHAECVKALVRANGDVNTCNNTGASPLYIAARNGHVESVRALVAAGADVSRCNNNGASPLYIAAQNGHLECIHAILDAGGDVNMCNNNNSSPLHIAAQNDHLQCVSALVARGGDVNKSNSFGATPLHIAARHGHVAVVTELVRAGADVNKCDKQEFSPLASAVQTGSVACVKALLAAGADLHKRNTDGISPLLIASRIGNAECVGALVAAGSDANLSDTNDTSPLTLASRSGSVECVRILIGAGADVNKHSKTGACPLSVASYHGHASCAQVLIAAGAVVNPPVSAVLSFGAVCDQSSAVIGLGDWWHIPGTSSDLSTQCWEKLPAEAKERYRKIDKAEDLEADCYSYCTGVVPPLSLACCKGHAECVVVLLSGGANINAPFLGLTPIAVARAKGHSKCVEILESAGAK